MRTALPTIRQSLARLQHLLRTSSDTQRHQRIHYLYLVKSEQVKTKSQAADILGVHRNTISAWSHEYERGGLRGLLQIDKPGGSVAPLNAQDIKRLRKRLRKRLCSPEGFGSYAEAQAWIEKELHVCLTLGATFYWVHIKCGASPKVARPSHIKKTLRSVIPSPNV